MLCVCAVCSFVRVSNEIGIFIQTQIRHKCRHEYTRILIINTSRRTYTVESRSSHIFSLLYLLRHYLRWVSYFVYSYRHNSPHNKKLLTFAHTHKCLQCFGIAISHCPYDCLAPACFGCHFDFSVIQFSLLPFSCSQ